jgi:hypothetical protein
MDGRAAAEATTASLPMSGAVAAAAAASSTSSTADDAAVTAQEDGGKRQRTGQSVRECATTAPLSAPPPILHVSALHISSRNRALFFAVATSVTLLFSDAAGHNAGWWQQASQEAGAFTVVETISFDDGDWSAVVPAAGGGTSTPPNGFNHAGQAHQPDV